MTKPAAASPEFRHGQFLRTHSPKEAFMNGVVSPNVEQDQNHPQPGPIVGIFIDGVPKNIHRGRQTVVDIKNLGGISLAWDLEQKINGQLVPLADDGGVTIKGGEEFFSHV